MRIVVVGASGLVGGNCLRAWAQHQPDWDVVGTHFGFAAPGTQYYNTLHPDDEQNLDMVGFRPDWIVHCGALTHVDHCEQHPDESFTQTVQSTINLIALAKQTGARMAYFSTDYVFDGLRGPYHETDAVNPLSVYGQHKLQAEQLVLNEVPGSLVLRITNVYGDEVRGKNFIARIISQLQEGKQLSLRLPVDQYATPANAWDIARALGLLIRDGQAGIWHLGATEFLNRVALANKVGRFFPAGQLTVVPVTTVELAQPAKRPLIGGLVNATFCNTYPDFTFGTVDGYLRSKLGRS